MIATKKIKKGQVIATNHVLVVPDDEVAGFTIEHYVWDWGGNKSGIVLGDISLANHSSSNTNAQCESDNRAKTLSLVAIKNISPGEEICHNYSWPEEYQPEWYKREERKSAKQKSKK